MFRSPEYIVSDLTEAILNGSINDKVYAQAKAQADAVKAKKEAEKAEAKKQRAIWETEQKKPCNWIPQWYRMRKVYPQIWLEYLQTYNLTELINYASELRDGKWWREFPDGSGEHAYQLINAQITQRINASTSIEAQKEAIAKAQDKLKQAKAEFDEQRRDVEATHLETKKLMEEVYPASPAKAKPYTT